MIDHTGLQVSDPISSRGFYDNALAPLGYQMMVQIPTEHTGGMAVFGYGLPPKADFGSIRELPTFRDCTLPSVPKLASRSTSSTRRHLHSAGRTTGRPVGDRIITKITTVRLCWIPTDTTSKPFVMSHRK
jgi:hypothetical protein